MKNLFKPIARWWRLFLDIITPSNTEIKNASRYLWITTIIIWLATVIISLLRTGDIYVVVFFVLIFALALLISRIAAMLIKGINSIPQYYKLALFTALAIIISAFSFSFFLPLSLIVVATIIGGSIICFRKDIFRNFSLGQKIVRVLGLFLGFACIIVAIYLYSINGFTNENITNAAAKDNRDLQLSINNPGNPGNNDVEVLLYGSGKDKYRDEFGKDVDLKTDSIDGTTFIDNWKGFGGWYRTKYWGFDYKALPLNARVWYPKQNGNFPLVLVVHGNHGMQDYSDPGYGYLGELLASRGFIVASIDENFLNGSWSDIFGGLKKENDARAWILLEHLKLWHKWNKDSTNVFYHKIDTNNIALIGHSRGGEAVVHAACFNKLPYYPDDALTKLDYNFNIKSVIAIAPCDGQYKPANDKTSLTDIDYFVLHGAQDSDVRSFMGSQQYERISFTDSTYHFKTGLYIYAANHGQFNTTWGLNDMGVTFARLLNTKPIMKAEEQRQVAKVYISAFLETTLKKNYSYLPLFMDHRTAKEWLPETIYLNQFQDSKHKLICTFDEDINLASTKNNSNAIIVNDLTVWKEKLVNLKWGNKGSRAVYLGWNNEKDSTKNSYYNIDISQSNIETDSSSVLVLSISDADEDTNPKTKGKWLRPKKNSTKKENKEEKESEDNIKKKTEDNKPKDRKKADKPKGKEAIDFTIRLTDNKGQKIEFPISQFSFLQPKLKVMLTKSDYLRGNKQSENVFQLFKFPLKELVEKNEDFNINKIKNICFVFNKTKKGVVIIDDIGFSRDFDKGNL